MKNLIFSLTITLLAHALYGQNGNGNGNGNGNNTFPTNGYAGIGTNNPNKHLQVNGNVQVDSTLVVSESATFSREATVGEDLIVEGQIYAPNMESTEDNETNIVVIDQNGQAKTMGLANFLVGAYSSDCMLAQLGTGSNTSSVAPVWQATGVANSSTGYLFTGSDCPAHVGIGTSTPRSRLDVIGTTYTDKLAIGVDPSLMSARMHLKFNLIDPNQTDILKIENSTRQLLNLDNDGLLRAREIKVDAVVWPDYVFEENYELMPLEEVNEFIQENGHLPNVPCASDLEEEGVNVYEMNKLLMEKVEELTLHLIDLNQRLEEQQTKINQLENK